LFKILDYDVVRYLKGTTAVTKMGNFKLELFKMSCYLGFPLAAFLSYNRPDLFGQDRNKIRQDVRDRMFLNRPSEEERNENNDRIRARVKEIQDRKMSTDIKDIK